MRTAIRKLTPELRSQKNCDFFFFSFGNSGDYTSELTWRFAEGTRVTLSLARSSLFRTMPTSSSLW